jgi:hypothetical protein
MFLNIEEAVPVIGYVIISKTDQGMELLKKINKILADNITGTIYNLQLQNYDVQLIERFLVQYRNPGPLGQVRVQWLCHLYDSMLLNDQVVPTTYDQGVTNEPISKINTNDLALPISYCMGTEISVPGINRSNRD